MTDKNLWTANDMIVGVSYESKNFGMVTYQGINTYHNEQTHHFTSGRNGMFRNRFVSLKDSEQNGLNWFLKPKEQPSEYKECHFIEVAQKLTKIDIRTTDGKLSAIVGTLPEGQKIVMTEKLYFKPSDPLDRNTYYVAPAIHDNHIARAFSDPEPPVTDDKTHYVFALFVICVAIGCAILGYLFALRNNDTLVRHAQVMQTYIESSEHTRETIDKFSQVIKETDWCGQ